MNKINTTNLDKLALLQVIEYLEKSERQSYEEYVCQEHGYPLDGTCNEKELYDNPNVTHIYATVRRLKDSMITG